MTENSLRQARIPKVAAGILLSAALTSFVTGVTEPIEFAFLFVAPVLFLVHAVLTGTSLAICTLLNIKIGFGFSAGLIDYVLNFTKSNTTMRLVARRTYRAWKAASHGCDSLSTILARSTSHVSRAWVPLV